jgi:hypothetical protein
MAWITYEEVQKLLQPLSHKAGSYVFRMSVTRPGLWSIGFVSPYGLILQALPTNKSLYQALIDGAADGSYLYPLGQANNCDPREHMPVMPENRIVVRHLHVLDGAASPSHTAATVARGWVGTSFVWCVAAVLGVCPWV